VVQYTGGEDKYAFIFMSKPKQASVYMFVNALSKSFSQPETPAVLIPLAFFAAVLFCPNNELSLLCLGCSRPRMPNNNKIKK